MYPDLCLLSYTACSHSGRADTAASLCWHVPTDSQQCRDLLDSHEKCVQLLTQNAPQVWPQRIESWSLSQWQGKGFYHAHSDTQSHIYTHCCNKLRVCKLRCVFDHIQAKGDPTFKDNDFIQMDGMVSIGEEAKTDFMSKIEADVEVCLTAAHTHKLYFLLSLSLVSTKDEPHGLQSAGWYSRLLGTDQWVRGWGGGLGGWWQCVRWWLYWSSFLTFISISRYCTLVSTC